MEAVWGWKLKIKLVAVAVFCAGTAILTIRKSD